MKPSPILRSHILLVDDNRDGLLVRGALLSEIGCCVEFANSGEEGLELYESASFDVVVTDFRMPGMNGVELIARIRQINPNARIVLLSGFVEPLGLTEENTGADAVIAKSANEAVHLLRAIKRLATRATLRKPVVTQKNSYAKVRSMVR